jgi:hypothetical protein
MRFFAHSIDAAAFIVLFLFATVVRAQPPCDFKGIAVGNKMAPAEIMAALGVPKYKMNPPHNVDWTEVENFGIIPASELEDWRIGSYCDENSCRVPGLTIGDDHIATNVFIHLIISHEEITEIGVSSTIYSGITCYRFGI